MLDLYQHDEPFYPSSDNEPMGENDVICWLMTTTLDMLKRHFQDDERVYVSSNSFVYYVKGEPKERVAPDLYVVKGVSSRQRRNYKIFEEGVVPQVVFEFSTDSSRFKDLGTKKGLYELLGVKEYYVFDPAGEYLSPPFRAYILVDGVWVRNWFNNSNLLIKNSVRNAFHAQHICDRTEQGFLKENSSTNLLLGNQFVEVDQLPLDHRMFRTRNYRPPTYLAAYPVTGRAP